MSRHLRVENNCLGPAPFDTCRFAPFDILVIVGINRSEFAIKLTTIKRDGDENQRTPPQ